MGRQSQDVIVRFIGDTGNLGKGLDGLQGRFQAVTSSIDGIVKAGAAIGALSFFKTAIDEAREAARVTRQTEAVIRSTGAAANVTADHVAELSGRLSELAGVDDEVIQHGANLLLTFTRVRNEMGAGNDIFDQATQASLDMSAAMAKSGDAGEGLQETAIRIGKALNDPVKGMTALAKVGVTFTAAQKEQVKALVESGDILGAQKIVLAELKTEFGGMAEATADSTAKAQVGFANLAEAIGMRLLPAVNAVSSWAVNTGIPALGKVASTTADVVEPAFKFLVDTGRDLVKTFADLPSPVQAGVIALAAWKLVGDGARSKMDGLTGSVKSFGSEVSTVMTASQGEVGRFGASMQVLQDRVPTVGAMGAAFRTAKGDVEGFAGTVRGVGAASLTGFKAGVSGLVGALGGPWGLAIAGATAGLTMWISSQQKAKAAAEAHTGKVRALTQEIIENGGALTKQTQLQRVQEAQGKGLYDVARKIGVSTMTMTDAILGNVDAIGEVNRAWDAANKQAEETATDGFDGIVVELAEMFIKADDARNGFGDLSSSMVEANTNATLSKERLAEMGIVIGDAGDKAKETAAGLDAMGAAASSSDMLKASVEALGGKFDDTKTDGQHLVDVIKGLTDAQTNAIDLEENYEAALDGLTASIKDNGKTLDIHTEKGRSNRDALENAAKAIRDRTLADIEAGVPAAEAIARHDARARALQTEANKAGFAKTESQLLIAKYSEIPKNVRTIIETQGFEETQAKLEKLSAGQYLLAKGIPVTPANLRQFNQERRFNNFASGGLINGPGGPKSDIIPIWASNKEFMQPADTVAHYGVPFMEALRQKRIPRMAQGGYLNWPFPVDTTKTQIPAFGSAIQVGAVGAGVSRWAPLVLQVLAMLGQPSSLLPNVLRRMNQESGGNPTAINNWDINAQRGDPSRGLMQTIGGTFNRWAGPFVGRGIYDPLANIFAGLNYAIHRYPSLQYAMDKPGGYKDGGWLQPGKLGLNETSKPERILNDSQWDALAASGGNNYHLTVNGPVGSQRELENWFVRMADKTKSKGRLG